MLIWFSWRAGWQTPAVCWAFHKPRNNHVNIVLISHWHQGKDRLQDLGDHGFDSNRRVEYTHATMHINRTCHFTHDCEIPIYEVHYAIEKVELEASFSQTEDTLSVYPLSTGCRCKPIWSYFLTQLRTSCWDFSLVCRLELASSSQHSHISLTGKESFVVSQVHATVWKRAAV